MIACSCWGVGKAAFAYKFQECGSGGGDRLRMEANGGLAFLFVLEKADDVDPKVDVEMVAFELIVVEVEAPCRAPLGPATGAGEGADTRREEILVRQTGHVFAVCSHC